MLKAKGFVVAIDGQDGVGKSTQVQLLADHLEKSGRKVHATRHSGGTPISEALRQVSRSNVPRPVETYFYISMAMGEALCPDLIQRKSLGETVVLDRSPLSIIAYNGYGSRLPDKQRTFEACERFCMLGRIDLIIVLTARPKTLEQRQKARNMPDYFELQGHAYHERVRQGYIDAVTYMQKHGQTKVVTIDASSDIMAIHKAIVDTVNTATTN